MELVLKQRLLISEDGWIQARPMFFQRPLTFTMHKMTALGQRPPGNCAWNSDKNHSNPPLLVQITNPLQFADSCTTVSFLSLVQDQWPSWCPTPRASAGWRCWGKGSLANAHILLSAWRVSANPNRAGRTNFKPPNWCSLLSICPVARANQSPQPDLRSAAAAGLGEQVILPGFLYSAHVHRLL